MMELWGYVSIFRFVFRRPKVPRGATSFTYHQPVLLSIIALLLMSSVELVVADILVRRWETVRIVLLVLSAWGLVWMLGYLFGMLTRPHAVGPEGIRARAGAEIDVAMSWADIESVERHQRRAQVQHVTTDADGNQSLHLPIQHETNIDITLRQPVTARLPQGTETVSQISLYADQPDAFVAEVGLHRASRVT